MNFPFPRFLILPATLLLCMGAGVAAPGSEDQRLEAVVKYASLADTWYTDCVAKAEKLKAAVDVFLEKPDAAKLGAARAAWLEARVPYRKTECLRFYGGPIEDDDGMEHQLNSWPVDESYLERVPGSAADGLVENTSEYPKLTTQLLERLNEREGEKNLTTGWHVVEFLLWGQDLSEKSAGQRPFTDYSTAPHAERRAELLRLTTAKLVTDLRYIAEDWKPGELGNYRAMWTEGTEGSFGNILTGLTLLCEFELSGSRIQVPHDTQEQEEEHSCFSDSTHLDHLGNLLGIREVWGLLKPFAKSESATAISAQVEKCIKLAGEVPVPFDQAIRGEDTAPGRVVIKALLVGVEDLGAALRKLGETWEVEIPETLDIVE